MPENASVFPFGDADIIVSENSKISLFQKNPTRVQSTNSSISMGKRFWTRSYCVISVGDGASTQVIEKYIQKQKRPANN